MIKKLLVIGFLTGAAHLSTVLVLKKLTGSIPASDLKQIAELDAVFNLIIILLGLGLLSSTVRDIALKKDWKNYYIPAQKARLTLSIFFLPLAALGLLNNNYYLLTFAPLFALHGDYALYGKGYAKLASLLAFFRVFVTSLMLFLASLYFKESIVSAFAISNILVYFISGLIISKVLKVPYLFAPNIKTLSCYISSFYLGIVAFGYYFLGLGLIIVAGYFYNDATIALAYIYIKAYIIYKGVLRIIVQAFISEMNNREICLRIDNLCSLGGMSAIIAALLFPQTTTQFILDTTNTITNYNNLIVIGITGFMISPFISLTTTAMLKKKDKEYGLLSALAVFLSSLILITFSFFIDLPENILFSVLIGEVICFTGLLIILKMIPDVKERLVFIIYHLPLLTIPALARYFLGDSTKSFLFSIVLFLVIGIFINRKKFLQPVIQG